jgi:predicted enzyme related to lactoylglutathione lyase
VTARGLVWMGVPTDDFGGTVAFFRDVMGLETFYGGESVEARRR